MYWHQLLESVGSGGDAVVEVEVTVTETGKGTPQVNQYMQVR